jgi:hypothetical protein
MASSADERTTHPYTRSAVGESSALPVTNGRQQRAADAHEEERLLACAPGERGQRRTGRRGHAQRAAGGTSRRYGPAAQATTCVTGEREREEHVAEAARAGALVRVAGPGGVAGAGAMTQPRRPPRRAPPRHRAQRDPGGRREVVVGDGPGEERAGGERTNRAATATVP